MGTAKRKGPKSAIALGYDKVKDQAPRIIATGRGEVAAAILAAAGEHGVPVHTDHPLAEALVRLEIGQQVPPELYAAIAEVLAFLWHLEQEQAAKGGTAP